MWHTRDIKGNNLFPPIENISPTYLQLYILKKNPGIICGNAEY